MGKDLPRARSPRLLSDCMVFGCHRLSGVGIVGVLGSGYTGLVRCSGRAEQYCGEWKTVWILPLSRNRGVAVERAVSARGCGSLLLGDHEIPQFPGVLIRLDSDLLRLLVHLQFACRQRCPLRAFFVGRKE